jgi:hypothetical protein
MRNQYWPTLDLRFVVKDEVPEDGVSSSRKVLQQKWRFVWESGPGFEDNGKEEWRDVPLVTDADQ